MSKRTTTLTGILALVACASLLVTGCEPPLRPATMFCNLPDYCNNPDGARLCPKGNIILSVPNFNNMNLPKDKQSPAIMMMIDKDRKLSKWYEFKPQDLHPETKKVGPMGCDFGPDGNLYVGDNQLFYNNKHKSRILRINVKDGKAVSCDVVLTGMICANGLVRCGDRLFVSETQLIAPPEVKKGQPKPKLISGVYAIKFSEFKNGPVHLTPYVSKDKHDPHLVSQYETSSKFGFGADGVTCDGCGNLYCGIFEDGIIYKTTFNKDGSPKETVKWVYQPEKMACCDGIFWRKRNNKIYVADMVNNAVQAVDVKTKKITTIARNGDTDGSGGLLDQPCEVLFRGNELIVVNFDMPFPGIVNTKFDKPYTVSVVEMPPCKCPKKCTCPKHKTKKTADK